MSSSYLIQPDLTVDPVHLVDKLPFPHPPDQWQKHAFSAIDQGHDVLVCAPTGSGKTKAGEFAIHHHLKKGNRIFYTTPIKSLSNQKFADLTQDFPETTVGIMTGDIKFRPDAQILVMTTEILRNLLYKQGTDTHSLGLTASLSTDKLGAIVFDECHYINDPDRGNVWEETMILAPPGVQLVGLSATLERADLLAAWLGNLRKIPIQLIQTKFRVVPLTHTILHPVTDEFQTVLTPTTELFQEKVYKDYLTSITAIQKGHEEFKDKVHNKVLLGEKGAVAGKQRPKTFIHRLNHCLDLLRTRHQLPALFFVFSRKGCEEYASRVCHDFLDGGEASNVRHIIDFHLKRYKSLETLPQFHQLRALLLKGIAFHHSGLLPLLKEIIEILFAKGLVKVLFATETFAVGLNMPTKTVVFTGLKKYDDRARGMRLLRTDEYTQMAGRAGRRGKDVEGLVVYLPDDRGPVEITELYQIMKGSRSAVNSRMNFHYDFLLKTLHNGNRTWLELMEQSYWYQQRLRQIELSAKDIVRLEAKKASLEATLPADLKALCDEKLAFDAAIKAAGGNKYKKIQQELVKWMATHSSARLTTGLANYESLRLCSNELTSAVGYDADLRAHATHIQSPVDFLRGTGYLKDDETPRALKDLDKSDLTLKGILATEINEGHPILMTELFLSKKAHALDGPCLATLLSVFLEDFNRELYLTPDKLDIPRSVTDVMAFLNGEANLLGDLEYKLGAAQSDDAWNLSLQWAEPVFRWITEPEIHVATVCTDYGLFEGNFVRGLLKLGNLLDEWLSMATFCEHADQIEKLAALKGLVIRDLVLPESLYLRL